MPALTLPLYLALAATTQAPPQPTSIEIDISTGHIILPVYIEDNGPYWFILDTGNQNTAIFNHIAESAAIETEPFGEMGGAGSGSVSVHQAADIEVRLGDDKHPLEFTDPLVTVLPDEAQLPDFNGKTIAGFLGASLIEQYMTTIDYADALLTFTPHADYTEPKDARIMQMPIVFGFPYFEGSVTPTLMGEPTKPVVGNFLLDLGATFPIEIDHDQALERGLVDADDPDQQAVGQAMGIDGVLFDIRTAPLAEATMGTLKLDEPSVLFATSPGGGPPIENLVGAIGSGLFQSSTITLDYKNNRLIWHP